MLPTILATLLIVALLVLVISLYCYYRLSTRAALREKQFLEAEAVRRVEAEEETRREIALALRGQKAKISGEDVAKFCPFSPEYPYNTRDVVAVFDTWDYTVLVGKVEGEITEVIFQEMKAGKYSRLNQLQHSLRDCIRQGKVRWETWQLDKETGIWHRIHSD